MNIEQFRMDNEEKEDQIMLRDLELFSKMLEEKRVKIVESDEDEETEEMVENPLKEDYSVMARTLVELKDSIQVGDNLKELMNTANSNFAISALTVNQGIVDCSLPLLKQYYINRKAHTYRISFIINIYIYI